MINKERPCFSTNNKDNIFTNTSLLQNLVANLVRIKF